MVDKIRTVVRWSYDLAEGPEVSKRVEELVDHDNFTCADYKDVRNLSFPSTTRRQQL